MMDGNLDWTEQLGDAFLAQQSDVMDVIQRLRRRAQVSGALASTPQQTVSTVEQEIIIEPAAPEIVYVPVYDPWCIYGAWPYPDYPPFYFGDWSGYCVPANYLIAFGVGIYPFGYWAWGQFEWRRHIIRIDHDRYLRFHTGHEPRGGILQHDPSHRHGVPYRDPATAARFLGPAGTARGYRGYAPGPAVVPSVRPSLPSSRRGLVSPSSTSPLPPAFRSYGPGSQVRGESERGHSSRMTPPAAPAPSFHAPPMPSFHGGGGGFHGGSGGGGFHGGGGGGGFHGGGGAGGFHGGGGGGGFHGGGGRR